MTTAVQVYEPEAHNALVLRNAAILELRDNMFQRGVHYGEPYKGAGKPTLLKAGAETIMSRFKLWPKFIERSMVEKWDADSPIFHYRYECQLIHRETGEIWGAGIGSCNSMEDKYRWRKQDRVCPNCSEPKIIPSKFGSGWYCLNCKSKFPEKDERVTAQEVGRVPNDEIFTIVNTLDKMAQKRAFVSAVLVATGASAYFTQDVEDFPGYAGEVIDGDYTVTVDEHGEVQQPEPTPEPTEPPVSIPEPREQPQPVATHQSKPKPAQKRAEKPTTSQNGNGAEFQTIRKYWPDVAQGLMGQKVSKLVEDGINVGFILYGPNQATIQKLGYESSEEFKRKAKLASSKDYPGTLEELLNTAIILSPAA